MTHTPENNHAFDDFISVLQSLIQVTEDISRIESEKASAVSERKHELLDGYIQQEQAAILRLRGLEQKRSRLTELLGWKNLRFREILKEASPAQYDVLFPLFTQLEEGLANLTSVKADADQIIKARIRELEIFTARMQQTYGSKGTPKKPMPSPRRDTYV